MLQKNSVSTSFFSFTLSCRQQTNIVAFLLTILAILGGYYLIETTLLETHTTSGLGAIKYYNGLKLLKDTKDKLRFVSIGATANIPLFYGLDTFDGFIHNSPYRRNYYIAYAIYDPPLEKLHTHTHFFFSAANLDFNMFKMANIGYIFTDKPIFNNDLTLTDQSKPVYVNDLTYPLKKYIEFKFKNMRLVNQSYIYLLKGVWPRIFSAKSIRKSSFSFRDKRYYLELKRITMGDLLIAKEDYSENVINFHNIQPITIKNYILNEKGVIINTISKGGVLVFNQVFTPFWSATCDGKKLSIFPVNGIMMATYVPKDCSKVFFKYHTDSPP